MRCNLAIGGVLLCCVASIGKGAPITFGSWSSVQYEFNNQPDAVWKIMDVENRWVKQITANRGPDAAILLSDSIFTAPEIGGLLRVDTRVDNDFLGVVFGYQGRGNYYLFDWREQDDYGPNWGLAETGMSLKVVDTGGPDPTAFDLWPTNSTTGNVTLLRHNTIGWEHKTEYNFSLQFTPGWIDLIVREGSTVLEHWTVEDDTYSYGNIGLYNFSQQQASYQNFYTADPSSYAVPEPSSLFVWSVGGLSLLAIGWLRRRRRSHSD